MHRGVREWGHGEATRAQGAPALLPFPPGTESGCGPAGDHGVFAEPGRGSLLSCFLMRLTPAASRLTSLTIRLSQN